MLCDENEPEYLQLLDTEDAKHVSFEYKYLPENVRYRLMVLHGYELNTKVVCKNGAVFKNELCGWKALIQMKDNCLDVYAKADNQGTHPINSYLDSFRESIYEINIDFELSADEYTFYYRNGKKDRFKF